MKKILLSLACFALLITRLSAEPHSNKRRVFAVSGGGAAAVAAATYADLLPLIHLSADADDAAVWKDNPPTTAPTLSDRTHEYDNVLYWTDLSGNGNHFKYVGTPGGNDLWMDGTNPYTNEPTGLLNENYVYAATGSTSNYLQPDDDSTSLAGFNFDDSFTVAMVFARRGGTTYGRPFDKGDGTSAYGALLENGLLKFFIGHNTDGYINASGPTLTAGVFYYLVIVWDGATAVDVSSISMYLDGAAQSLSTVTNPTLATNQTNGTPLRIGTRVGGVGTETLSIHRFLVFDRALSAADQTTLDSLICTNYGKAC